MDRKNIKFVDIEKIFSEYKIHKKNDSHWDLKSRDLITNRQMTLVKKDRNSSRRANNKKRNF